MMPKLSVLMPVYNGERFLREAIESILCQTFSDYEFLIIDDGSQDSTKDIVSSYRDKRIRFVQNKKNLGQMETLNLGISLSRGQYIARMDQDDISLSQRFEKEIEILDKFSEISLVYSNGYIIDKNGKRRDKMLFDYVKPYRLFVFDKLLRKNFITADTVMIRKNIFAYIGVLNPIYPLAGEYDLFLRLSRKYRVDFVDDLLTEYRVHGENSSVDGERITKEVIEILSGLDRIGLGKKQRTQLDKMISWHTANLGMLYLFQYNRELCKVKAIESLRINPFNLKAVVSIFMLICLPNVLIDCIRPFRRRWLE